MTQTITIKTNLKIKKIPVDKISPIEKSRMNGMQTSVHHLMSWFIVIFMSMLTFERSCVMCFTRSVTSLVIHLEPICCCRSWSELSPFLFLISRLALPLIAKVWIARWFLERMAQWRLKWLRNLVKVMIWNSFESSRTVIASSRDFLSQVELNWVK